MTECGSGLFCVDQKGLGIDALSTGEKEGWLMRISGGEEKELLFGGGLDSMQSWLWDFVSPCIETAETCVFPKYHDNGAIEACCAGWLCGEVWSSTGICRKLLTACPNI